MYMAGPQFLQAITGADQPVRIAPFVLGFLGVGLYHAAYISEVIRTGIEAVPRGQMEAAQSEGFTRAGLLVHRAAPDVQDHPAAAVQPGAQLGQEHVGAGARRRRRPYVSLRQLRKPVWLPAGIHRLLPYVLHHLLSARHAGAVARAPLQGRPRGEAWPSWGSTT